MSKTYIDENLLYSGCRARSYRNKKMKATKSFRVWYRYSKITHDLTETKDGVETYQTVTIQIQILQNIWVELCMIQTHLTDLEEAWKMVMCIDSYELKKKWQKKKGNVGVVRDKDGNVMSEATSV